MCISISNFITNGHVLRYRDFFDFQYGGHKAVQFATEVTNRFTALEAAQNVVTPEYLWKNTNTVLLEVARDMNGSIKSQKNKKWISDETFAGKTEKQKAKITIDRGRYRGGMRGMHPPTST